MTNEERINALVENMEDWDNDSIVDWALRQYRSSLERTDELSLLIQYAQAFGETHASQN